MIENDNVPATENDTQVQSAQIECEENDKDIVSRYIRTDARPVCAAALPTAAPKTIQLNKKAVIMAVVIVLALVIAAYVMTFVVPKGEYMRDESGAIISGTYAENPELEGIEWWQFLLSPFLVLDPADSSSSVVYVILALMIVIGAVFNALDDCGILVYMVQSLSHRFGKNKYVLLFFLAFIFMFLGSAVGMFEEFIPLVPIVVLLCYAMGWDALVGLGISILAGCFGFAAGVVNPFTVGVAQTIGQSYGVVGMTMFSGIGMRLLTFGAGYLLLMAFIFPYAKRIEKYPHKSSVYIDDKKRKAEFDFLGTVFVHDKRKSRALVWFGVWICVILASSIVAIFWTALANYIMYLTIGVYVIAGIGAPIICGMKGKRMLKTMGKGAVTLLPALAMIMIACGVRYIIEKGDIMDTIIYASINFISSQPPAVAVLLIYGVIFLFEIFIPSGSAKAMLIMPMMFPICAEVGINGHVATLALAFGDGFANVLLPTSAGLLLILGLTTVDFKKWMRWSLPVQLCMLAVTIGVLMLSQFVVYA